MVAINLILHPVLLYEAHPFQAVPISSKDALMAKTSKINKNELRKKTVTKFRARRDALKALIKNPATAAADRVAAQTKLSSLPRDANPIRVVNRCLVTGRPRGNLRYFQLCRITFREKALKGELTGVVKASW
jgi:small subunit ribosomal protein S14